jgi:hypothetical protein
MEDSSTGEMIRVKTFVRQDDAERARLFLQSLGVAAVIMRENVPISKDAPNPPLTEDIYGLLVPDADFPRAIRMIGDEAQILPHSDLRRTNGDAVIMR